MTANKIRKSAVVVGHRHSGRSGHCTTCSFLKATPLLAHTQGLLTVNTTSHKAHPALKLSETMWKRWCQPALIILFALSPFTPSDLFKTNNAYQSLTLFRTCLLFVHFPSTDCIAPSQYSGLNFTCEVLLQHLPWSWHWLCFAGWWLNGPRHDLVLQQWLQLWTLS